VNVAAPATVNGGVVTTVAVPEAATLPSAVPAGGGATQTDFPVWGAAMLALAAISAVGAGYRLLGSRG
jgi:hypothetical protein